MKSGKEKSLYDNMISLWFQWMFTNVKNEQKIVVFIIEKETKKNSIGKEKEDETQTNI